MPLSDEFYTQQATLIAKSIRDAVEAEERQHATVLSQNAQQHQRVVTALTKVAQQPSTFIALLGEVREALDSENVKLALQRLDQVDEQVAALQLTTGPWYNATIVGDTDVKGDMEQ